MIYHLCKGYDKNKEIVSCQADNLDTLKADLAEFRLGIFYQQELTAWVAVTKRRKVLHV